ncbi:MAG: ectoine utilization protein EutA [Acidisphaera sp.]|nr:ectoine utilization protein EutA [Acidisphaera sp.]
MTEIRLGTTALAYDRAPRLIGLMLLATDHTSERDFARLVATQGVAVHSSRLANENPTNPTNLRKMQPYLAEAAALILPEEKLDAICYSCTSASVVIGDAAVEAAIGGAKPGTPVVTPPAAARAGLRALHARRISILTPYTVETSTPMAQYFVDHGFDVAGLTCFGLEDDRVMARITPETIVAAAQEAMARDADALFISCTALRAAEAAAAIEEAIARPVVTSNLATAWMCRGLAGLGAMTEGARLLRLPLPAGAA